MDNFIVGKFIRTAGSSGMILENYNGKYSLAAAREGKEGKINLKWAKEQKGREEWAEKATPIKVSLGEKETAIATLKMLLGELEGNQASGGEDEGVPF